MDDLLTTNNKLSPRTDLGMEQIDGDLLILDKRNQKIHQLNATASAVWASLDEGHNISAIAQGIVDTFDVSPEIAFQDVSRVLGEFSELGLLEE